MKLIIDKLKNLLYRLLFLIPTRLPVGVTEFDKWASSIIKVYNFPDNDSVRWALAVKVLHLGETDAIKAKHYFYLTMHKAMANQVVSQVIQDLKAKQQAAQAPKEVTTESSTQVTSNEAAASPLPN